MADVTFRGSYSAKYDETSAQLDRIFQAERDRARDGASALVSAVARLDAPTGGDVEPSSAPREPVRDERGMRSAARPDPTPFVSLPQRTTRGGPFGPKVREKLIREALEKRGWW